MAGMTYEDKEARKNKNIHKVSWVMFLFFVVSAFILLKYLNTKDYEMKQEIFRSTVAKATVEAVVDGRIREVRPSEWHYLGTSDTKLRPDWADGGYMVNLYAIASVNKDAFLIGAVTVDDRARQIYTFPSELRWEKGYCVASSVVSTSVVIEMFKERMAGAHADEYMDKLCSPYKNRFDGDSDLIQKNSVATKLKRWFGNKYVAFKDLFRHREFWINGEYYYVSLLDDDEYEGFEDDPKPIKGRPWSWTALHIKTGLKKALESINIDTEGL